MGLKKIVIGHKNKKDSDTKSFGTAFVDDNYIEDDLSTAKIVVQNWSDDIDSWLENINYLVSTSVSESFSYIIAEAMAKGIKPVIYDRRGVSDIWGSEFAFATISDAVSMILPESDYNSRDYKKLVKSRYALKHQIKKIRKLLAYDKTREEPKRKESEPESKTGKSTVLTLAEDVPKGIAIYEQHI